MPNQVVIETKKVKFPTAPELYGLFFEDINHAADGGLYPEMIRNRAFEDSLIPEDCVVDENRKIFITQHNWPGAFNHGEGMDEWAAAVPETEVPGWYASGAAMEVTEKETLNANRKAALKVTFTAGGKIFNIGYAGVNVEQGSGYHFYLFIKNEKACHFTVALEDGEGNVLGSARLAAPASEEYQRLDCDLTAQGSDHKGRVSICCEEDGQVLIGFTSLMPHKTYKGHGLREDLVAALKNTHAKFIRFPGGCVVEGINEKNALRFSRTIGPVWERPSSHLMWHYRTTNGLGFHEYLQLCEDLEMEAMYVCNCGMDCQARSGGGFSEELVEEYLQEALHALEYALGGTDTKYGAMRAQAGHPEPFRLKYLEIGNENWGEEYLTRYEKFYKALKAAYPDVIYISNSHTEEAGLPTEFVDEHYYDAPEFFLENTELFASYDRSGPRIFLGEYAVNGGKTIASMECALAEAAFLAGVEQNQDIVRLTAYAPLFQNSDYTAWKPNLIVFDNHQVYGIPSYHAISLMGKYRGDYVVECRVEGEKKPPVYRGISGIMCEKEGLLFANVKINGKSAGEPELIYGEAEVCEDGQEPMDAGQRKGYAGDTGAVQDGREARRMRFGTDRHHFTGKSKEWNEAFEEFFINGPFQEAPVLWAVFGQEDLEEYTFEADLKFDSDNPVTLSIWNFCPNTDVGCNEPKDAQWNVRSVRNQVWRLEKGMSATRLPGPHGALEKSELTPVNIDYEKFNHYKIVARHDGYDCYINDVLVEKKWHPLHPLVSAVASTSEDEVLLKLISVADEPMDMEIVLDCPIEKEITTEVLSAGLAECNSFENKTNVSAREGQLTCGGERFTYQTPAHSISVLRMKKEADRAAAR